MKYRTTERCREAFPIALRCRYLNDDGGLRFIKDINLKFKTFDHDDDTSLGMSFDYGKMRQL